MVKKTDITNEKKKTNLVTTSKIHLRNHSNLDYFHREGIIEEINQILNDNDIIAETTPSQFIELTKGYKHRYFSVCSLRGKKYFIHILLTNKGIDKINFLKEVKFGKILLSNPNILSYLPSYVVFSENSKTPWFIQEFIEGNVLENKDKVESTDRKINDLDIKLIAQTLFNLNNKLDDRIRLKLDLKNITDYDSYNQLIKKTLPRLKSLGIINESQLESGQEFITKTRPLLEKHNQAFIHGDFHLGNIFLNNIDGMPIIKIVDWENYCQGNFLYDLVFFYTRLYREPLLGKLLIREYISLLSPEQRSIWETAFRSAIIFILARYLNTLPKNYPLEYSKTEASERRNWMVNLLLAALTHFQI